MNLIQKEGEGFQPVALVLETQREVEAIASLVGSVIGDSNTTPRGITDKAFNLLGEHRGGGRHLFEGSITARKYKEVVDDGF